MNEPSMVSSRHMPAVNSTGRHKIAYQGSPAAALVPASTSSAISVAVSKPSPNSSPTGYMCQDLVIDLVKRPRNRLSSPRFANCRSSSAPSFSGSSRRGAPREHPQDADQDDDVKDGDQIQEPARDAGADQAGVVMQPRGIVLDRSGDGLDPGRQQRRQPEHHGGVAQREEESDSKGRCPSLISLRVVLSMAAMWSASNACRMPRV